MDETISMLSKSLGSFCNHLQTSVDALKQSIDRRPIPLGTFSQFFAHSGCCFSRNPRTPLLQKSSCLFLFRLFCATCLADSASSTFIQSLNRRVSNSSYDLDTLESMSFGSVSFEELLGHCNEVFKRSQNDIIELEDRLRSFGYVPGDY